MRSEQHDTNVLRDGIVRTFQTLDAPINLADLSCLHGTSIFVAGFSEQRQIVSWLHEALTCKPPGLVKEDECLLREQALAPKGHLPKNYRRLALCRETLYSHRPYEGRRCALNISLHYEWKSFMWNEARDSTFLARVRNAASRNSRPILVLLGGSPAHHFSQHSDHRQELQWAVDDAHDWNQAWIDDYLNATLQLFDAFGPSARLPANVCVLWRTSNIGPRHLPANGDGSILLSAATMLDTMHHPSVRNGVHDWLSRFTVSLARRAGLGVLDTNDITYTHPPPPVAARVAVVNGSTGASSARECTGQNCRRVWRSVWREGDLYHGWNASMILPSLCRRACNACHASLAAAQADDPRSALS